jgi:hypothetical protein
MKKIIAQFIPILLIFFLLRDFKGVIQYSHSTLGKLTALTIVVFYTIVDKIVGLFVCALVIFMYQSDYVESMLNIGDQYVSAEEADLTDSMPYLESETSKKEYPKGISAERLSDYNTVYTEPIGLDVFRTENCKDGELVHKNLVVRPEMAEHVFPNLERGDKKCNPCVTGCDVMVR